MIPTSQVPVNKDSADLLGSALSYARTGPPVIALQPCAKVPRAGTRGVHDATRDPDLIARWWRETPDANIGLAVPDGYTVLDVEADGIADLADRHLPHTVTARTGGGGFHYWFKLPPGVQGVNRNLRRLGLDADLKGRGGYVVGPGSVHPNGELYRWVDACGPGEVEVADAPGWLVDLLTADRREDDLTADGDRLTRDVAADADGLPDVIAEYTRNDTLFRFGCRLRAFGGGRDVILRALIGVNAERCSPQLDADEVTRIARSACRYERGPVRIANKILRAADLTDGAVFLALVIAATGGTVTNSEVAALADVTERTVRNWKRELREADLLEAATDRPADRYTLIPVNVVLDPDLDRGAKRLYCWLRRIANSDGIAQAGQEILGERIGAERTSIHRYAKELEAAGLVTVTQAAYARALGRRYETNRYRIARDGGSQGVEDESEGAETGATCPKDHLVRTASAGISGGEDSTRGRSRSWTRPRRGRNAVAGAVDAPEPASTATCEVNPLPGSDGRDAVIAVLCEVRRELGGRYPTNPASVRGLELTAARLIAREGPASTVEALVEMFAEEGEP